MSGYLSADELLENAPADCVEEDVDGVFGGKVRIRALSAGQQAAVKQAGITMNHRGADITWAAMEMVQFRLGVIQPKLTVEQVRSLHLASGPSFAKVIKRLDEISGLDKEELRKAQQEFPDTTD